MNRDDNYININLANQLLIPKSNIIEKEDIFRKKQIEMKELKVTIDDYEYISQFNVATCFKKRLTSFSSYPGLKN
jgi:hypothetical protein